MAIITYTFPSVNTSVQIGDTAYFTNPSTGFSATGFDVDISALLPLGLVTAVTLTTVSIDVPEDIIQPQLNISFIFFSKSNTVNMSGIKGYYGSAKFVNDSEKKVELYATACGIEESSK